MSVHVYSYQKDWFKFIHVYSYQKDWFKYILLSYRSAAGKKTLYQAVKGYTAQCDGELTFSEGTFIKELSDVSNTLHAG